VGGLQSRVDLQGLDADGGVEVYVVADLLSLSFEDILSLDLGDFDLMLVVVREAQATELEEDDLVPGESKNLQLQVSHHLLLNLRALSEEIIRGVHCGGVGDDIEHDAGEDGLFFSAVGHVDLEDLIRVDTVLQRNLKIELQAVPSAALDHRHRGIRRTAEFDCVDLDIVPLERMAKTDELYTVRVCLVLDSLEPRAVVQTNLVVRQHGEAACYKYQRNQEGE